jgi:hypothetical protein
MSSPFSRTIRSLHADSFRSVLIGVIVALVILITWGIWFFFAQVTLYEKSQSARVINGEIVVAEFPAQLLHSIQPAQPARLYLDGAIGQQVGTIFAIVTDVTSPSSQTEPTGQVKLFAFVDANSPIRLQEELTGQVEIEVEHLSPAQLVMRVSGLFVNN